MTEVLLSVLVGLLLVGWLLRRRKPKPAPSSARRIIFCRHCRGEAFRLTIPGAATGRRETLPECLACGEELPDLIVGRDSRPLTARQDQ